MILIRQQRRFAPLRRWRSVTSAERPNWGELIVVWPRTDGSSAETTVANCHIGGGVPEVFLCQLLVPSSSDLNSNFTASDTFAGHQKHSRYTAFIDLVTAEAALHPLAASYALPTSPGFGSFPSHYLHSSPHQPKSTTQIRRMLMHLEPSIFPKITASIDELEHDPDVIESEKEIDWR